MPPQPGSGARPLCQSVSIAIELEHDVAARRGFAVRLPAARCQSRASFTSHSTPS
jgi:hypothetical protein